MNLCDSERIVRRTLGTFKKQVIETRKDGRLSALASVVGMAETWADLARRLIHNYEIEQPYIDEIIRRTVSISKELSRK